MGEGGVGTKTITLFDDPSMDSVVNLLVEKHYTKFTKEELVKRENLSPNVVSKVLYKLLDLGAARYFRLHNKPYYIIWEVDIDKIIELSRQKETIDKKKGEVFFICPSCKKQFSYEEALDYNYTCPDCSVLLEFLGEG